MNNCINADMIKETLDRTRRIETRLTKFVLAMGMDAGSEKPRWWNGKVIVPSRQCSICDICAAIPINWASDSDIEVYVGDEFLGFYLPPPLPDGRGLNRGLENFSVHRPAIGGGAD